MARACRHCHKIWFTAKPNHTASVPCACTRKFCHVLVFLASLLRVFYFHNWILISYMFPWRIQWLACIFSYDNDVHSPRRLHKWRAGCDHTFCLQCVTSRAYKDKGSMFVQCPLDSTILTLGSKDGTKKSHPWMLLLLDNLLISVCIVCFFRCCYYITQKHAMPAFCYKK